MVFNIVHTLEMASIDSQKILVGGWKAFAEDAGVNKKEPMETFTWLSDSYHEYEDCREALEKTPGSKEWLKTYTFNKKLEGLPFSNPTARSFTQHMTSCHSGHSITSLLWTYKYALNNWDTWVHAKKRYKALQQYLESQIPLNEVYGMLYYCAKWLEKDGLGAEGSEAKLKEQCAKYEYPFTSVSNLKNVLDFIYTDLKTLEAERKKEDDERRYQSLIGSLGFLYENPCRWFDGPEGCSLSPVHPSRVSTRAMDEMETKYPGYKDHIEKVVKAIHLFWNEPYLYNFQERYSQISAFMDTHGVVAGEVE